MLLGIGCANISRLPDLFSIYSAVAIRAAVSSAIQLWDAAKMIRNVTVLNHKIWIYWTAFFLAVCLRCHNFQRQFFVIK